MNGTVGRRAVLAGAGRAVLAGAGRAVLAGAMGVAGATALSGCTSPASSGAGELRFAWWGNDVRAELTQQALELFMARRDDGVTVVGESGNFDNYFDRLATQVAGSDAPDVFQMNEWNLREYADRGALLDLAEYGFSAAQWPEGSNGTGIVGDKVYGATAGVGLQAVMVNPEVFDDAGIDLPDDTRWSWEDYHALATELTGAMGGEGHGTTYGAGDQITAAFYLAQHGKPLFDNGALTDDPALLAQWLAYWRDLVADATLPGAAVIAEEGGLSLEQQAFSRGAVAMQVIPANVVVQYEKTVGHELALMRIPTRTGQKHDLGMWYRASQLYCASSRGEHPEQAGALVDFLLNDPEAGAILLADRGVPPNTAVLESITDDLTPADQRVVDYMTSCEPDLVGAPEPPPAGAGLWTDALGRAAQDVMFDRSSPDAAASSVLDDLRAAMG